MMGKGRKELAAIFNVSSLVVSALKELKHCSVEAIENYIRDNYFVTQKTLSMIPKAIQRGVAFGVIQKRGQKLGLDSVMIIAIRKPPDRYLFNRRKKDKRKRNGIRKRIVRHKSSKRFPGPTKWKSLEKRKRFKSRPVSAKRTSRIIRKYRGQYFSM